jgi:hypothetical protein
MKGYSKPFLEAVKHPRIQGMVLKPGDKVLLRNEFRKDEISIIQTADDIRHVMFTIKGYESNIVIYPALRKEFLFIPEVYNPKNPYRSLIGMLGDNYNINKYRFEKRTYYDVTINFTTKSKTKMEEVFGGEDFQLTLLKAVIFIKTGQRWSPSKKCWSKAIYKLI